MRFNKRFAGILVTVTLFFYASLSAQVTALLPRSTPEAQGVSSADISRFLEAGAKTKNEFHSFVFLRHGNVIAEGWWDPYKPSLRHTLYSTSKSFTSTAVGFAVTEGLVKLSDKVVTFFPAELPDTVSAFLAALTIKDLITMSVGQTPDPTGTIIQKNNWVKSFLALPITDTPGTKFLYNSTATYMLSAIVQKVSGQKIFDYLKPRLFDPLGIGGIDWEVSPEDINTGGWGLRLKTEDMAKFGQLYLQKGMWQGKQILPSAWIEEATTFKIKNAPDTALILKASSDWAQGYCYQFWRCRNNAFRADGAFGQYIIVMPEKDAVIAITSETADMQSILNLVWEYLLPAMMDKSLTADEKNDIILKKQLTSLSLKVPAAGRDSLSATKISGKNFVLEENADHLEKISFFAQKNIFRVTLGVEGKSYYLFFGKGKWQRGAITLPWGPPSLTGKPREGSQGFSVNRIANAYSWKNDTTLLLTVRYIESAHTQTFICHFDGNNITVRIDNSIKGMTPGANDKNPVIKGKNEGE
jgi:CubicO group peptidase (beta-lactamase class C family)